MANFLVAKFSLPWQRRSGANLNDILKPADPENLQFGTTIWDILTNYNRQLCVQISQFSLPWYNRDTSEASFNDTIKLADPEAPLSAV